MTAAIETHTDVPSSVPLRHKLEVFALVIAIDVYKLSSIPRLHGCVNDGQDFYDYLIQGNFAVPPRNILSLFNESATRDNILTAFNSHLINNERIAQDDLIIVFYAGHGDSVEAPGWNTDGRMVETICPYDVTAFEPTARPLEVGNTGVSTPKYGIPDRTINALMRQLAKKKGDNIVAIFDCCHSGGITRDPQDMLSRSLSSHNAVPARLPLPLDLDRELFQGVFDIPSIGARDVDLVLPSGFAYSGTKSHVLLAACQPKEKARETTVDGIHRGRFTYHLLNYLRDISPTSNYFPITYATLVEEVSKCLPQAAGAKHASRVSQSSAPDAVAQQPLCEGRHKHRILFSTEEEAPINTFPLSYEPVSPGRPQDGEALYVKAGSIQGIVEDTRFVYRYLKPDTVGVEAFVNITLAPASDHDAVEADRSRLSPVGTIWQLPPEKILAKESLSKHAVVSITTWGSKPMKIWCALGIPFAVPLERSRFERVGHPDDADVFCSLYQSAGSQTTEYLLEKRDPISLHFNSATPELLRSTPFTDDDAVLDAIAKFNFQLYWYNASPEVRQDLPFDVRLHPLKRNYNGGLQSILGIAGDLESDLLSNGTPHRIYTSRTFTYGLYRGFELQEAVVTDLDPYYGLTVVNRSKFDLFVYVFYFDPADYSITEWYRPPNNKTDPLEPGRELAIGYGTDIQETLKFSLAEEIKKETGFIKVFVSNVYVDMSSIAQRSPLLDKVGGRGAAKVPMQVLSGWNSRIYALTVARSEDSL